MIICFSFFATVLQFSPAEMLILLTQCLAVHLMQDMLYSSYIGFRATLNSQNFKVILKPMYRFFENCQKLRLIMLIKI